VASAAHAPYRHQPYLHDAAVRLMVALELRYESRNWCPVACSCRLRRGMGLQPQASTTCRLHSGVWLFRRFTREVASVGGVVVVVMLLDCRRRVGGAEHDRYTPRRVVCASALGGTRALAFTVEVCALLAAALLQPRVNNTPLLLPHSRNKLESRTFASTISPQNPAKRSPSPTALDDVVKSPKLLKIGRG
jgi:hypothetical protein